MGERAGMICLVSGYNFVNHVIRSSVPPLVPFVVREFAFTQGQEALLLSAFFQGYLLTQVPGGWASQKWGAKLIATLNLSGNGVLLLLPLAARGGSRAMAACLCLVGMCQGPLVPS
eukprot:COSAG01_NODE_25337_length_747_cov_1.103236_1_plen_115_part_01